jgi:type I restriction enzyme, S subunit
VEITGGGTPSRDRPEFWNGGIPWASVKDLVGPVLSATQETISAAGLANSASRLIPPGHVVIATRMGLGKASINTVPIAINQDLKAMRCGADLDPHYLLHFLLWKAPQLEAMGTGATVKGLKLEQLARLAIPLPPLAEQRRIAAILDKADAVRHKRQQAIQLTGDLLRSAFLDMFGDPGTNPRQWPRRRFGECLSGGMRNGVSPAKGGKVKHHVLTLAAVTGDRFQGDAVKEASFATTPAQDHLVQSGDFLICRGNGNLTLVGRGHFATHNRSDVVFPDTVIAARVDNEQLRPAFLELLWASALVRSQIQNKARTTSGIFKVNQTMLGEVFVLVPPTTLQDLFGKVASAVTRLRGAMLGSVGAELFDSLVQRAFRGEL